MNLAVSTYTHMQTDAGVAVGLRAADWLSGETGCMVRANTRFGSPAKSKPHSWTEKNAQVVDSSGNCWQEVKNKVFFI